ncbi:MAG TPA: right-handed parallel beta-helix repeat-containing protein [Bryobacteraceae bacterium]|nr:right-handed parallel beta-helix repeat-containing protein [Bryobacteraceae bacterium]
MSKFHGALSALLFTAMLFAPAPRALAVDGTVLINQSTSVNGLPGCQHSGFPIQICQSGSYRLSGNLTVPGTADGIDISAANVTLDLNGFMISGPVNCDGFPVVQEDCSPSDAGFGVFVTGANVRIFGGTVRGFKFGILGENLGFRIVKVEAFNNLYDGILNIVDFSSAALVDSNNASLNGRYGIWVLGGLISNNVVNENGGGGINTGHSTISNNTILANGGFGIQTDCPSSVVGNTVSANQGTAIALNGTGCVDANNAQ